MLCVTNYGDNKIVGHYVDFSSYIFHALFRIVFERMNSCLGPNTEGGNLSLHHGAKQVTVVGRCVIKLWPHATGSVPRCFTFHNSNDKTSPLHSYGNQYHGWQSFWLSVKLGRCHLQCNASDLIFISATKQIFRLQQQFSLRLALIRPHRTS